MPILKKKKKKLQQILPRTPTILGDSPGAWVELMTVRAEVWDTVLTQAGPMKGAPKSPDTKLMKQERIRSQWKPDPFTMFFSGLLKIRLEMKKRAKKMIRFCGRHVNFLLSVWNEQTHYSVFISRDYGLRDCVFFTYFIIRI